MIQSMTGYGETSLRQVRCEIKTLNHRFLKADISIPPELSSYELRLKRLLRERLARGAIFLKIFLEADIEPDIERARAYYNFLVNLKQSLKINSPIPIDLFIDFKKTKSISWRTIKQVTNNALDKVIESRIAEGRGLQAAIKLSLKRMDKLLHLIRQYIPKQVDLRKNFKEKLAPFMKEGVDEHKIDAELAFLLVKQDFNEERVRLEIHLAKFKELISTESPSGKYLTFLTQEMLREANTISSKVQDAKISHLVVEFKKELEDLREQVENVR